MKINEAVLFLGRKWLGKKQTLEVSLATVISGGHLLFEGVPGLGKTLLAESLCALFQGKFSRVQMTSDLLPGEITGGLRLNPATRELEFREGPLFSNFVLIDELNRASPKTQSALLQAMSDQSVSVDKKTHPLPSPFTVIATQNPLESHGVFELPESELDRFTVRIVFTYPDKDEELRILRNEGSGTMPRAEPEGMTLGDLERLRIAVNQVFIEESVLSYIYEIIHATRVQTPSGVSVRGGIQLTQFVKALALVRGKDFVTPDLVKEAVPFCLSHRLTRVNQPERVLGSILEEVTAPR